MFPSPRDIILSAVVLGAVLDLALQVSGRAVVPRDDKPGLPYDSNTIASCTYWHDNDGSIPCSQIPIFYAIKLADFLYWNPSLTSSCENFQAGRSYCVEGPPVPPRPSSTSARSTVPMSTPASTTTRTSQPPAATTTPGNGITTPTPTQPPMVGNCNAFHFVAPGESCGAVLRASGVSLAQLYTRNPSVNADCIGMWAGVYVCVGVVGSGQQTPNPTPTTSAPGNAIENPQPTQPGMVANCNEFAFVNPGDSCTAVAARSSITLEQFLQWNTGVGDQCQSMWVCVSVAGSTPTPTQAPSPGNGIQTPTPTQPNTTPNCKTFHLVQPGQGCWDLANKYGISVDAFIQWNPSVDSDCRGLWANTYACVAVL